MTFSQKTRKEAIAKNVRKDTHIHTDSHYAYRKAAKGYASHDFVNHTAIWRSRASRASG